MRYEGRALCLSITTVMGSSQHTVCVQTEIGEEGHQG